MSADQLSNGSETNGAPEPAASEKLQVRCAPGIMLTPEQVALLYKAFPSEKVILVKEEFRTGYSGAVVVLVTLGAGRAPLVIKFAHPHDLRQEYNAYSEFVSQVSPQNIAHLQGEPLVSDDGQLGMIQYTFAGGESHLPTNSLRAYYEHNGAEDTSAVLNRIFRVYGRHWWANNRAESYVLDEYYDRLLPVHLQGTVVEADADPDFTIRNGESSILVVRQAEIGQVVRLLGLEVTKSRDEGRRLTLKADPPDSEASACARIRVESSEPSDYRPGDIVDELYVKLTATRMSLLGDAAKATLVGFEPSGRQFTVPSGNGDTSASSGIVLPNPLLRINELLYSVVETKMSIIHGDLNLQNVLVDAPTGFSWLIDFAETRHGPTLLDLQRLEVQVITKLLPKDGAVPLAALAEMMTRLHSDPPLPAPPQPALQEPYTLLVTIRRLARQYLMDDLDWNEYYYGLIIALIGALKFDELDKSARGLALVCAACADSLIGQPLQTSMPAGGTETDLLVVTDLPDPVETAKEPTAAQDVETSSETPAPVQKRRPPVVVAPSAPKKSPPVQATEPEPAPSKSGRNIVGIVVGGLAVLLVLLAVAGFATWRSAGSDDTSTSNTAGTSAGAASATESSAAADEPTEQDAADADTPESDTNGAVASAGATQTADSEEGAQAESDATDESSAAGAPTADSTETPSQTPEDSASRAIAADTLTTPETPSATSVATAGDSEDGTSTPTPRGTATPDAAELEPLFTLNVRSGPGTSYPVVGSLSTGTAAAVVGRARMDGDNWYQIEYPSDNEDLAWITGNEQLVRISNGDDVPSISIADLPTPPPAATTAPALARGTAAEGNIYFSATSPRGRDNIYRVDASGGSPELIVQNARQPAVAPGLDWIAYQNLDDSSLGITGRQLSSNRQARYSSSPEDVLPTWNPDGSRVIYASNREGDRAYRLYEGYGSRELARGTEPDWHPTSNRIVYRGCDVTGSRCGLWTMEADGSGRQQLTEVASDSYPKWSPDGRSVVFMSSDRHGNWEIYSIDVASSSVERLTNSPSVDGHPAYSPDGSHIAFLSNRGPGGQWEVMTMSRDGTDISTVTALEANLPDWLAQGLDWGE